MDFDSLQLRVVFQNGRSDRFPFQTAIEIFEILEDDDLRALVVTDPERLKGLIQKEPLVVLRWILRRHSGKANHAAVKLAMGTLGVDGGRFTAWWRKAKKLAETSEWFEISGPAARVQVRLLDTAEDPAQGLRRQLSRSKNLGDALVRAKTLLAGGAIDKTLRDAACETLKELAANEREMLPHRLAAWFFLKEETGTTPSLMAEKLRAAAQKPTPADPSQPPALWALFQLVPGIREQERCIELLREAHGEGDWVEEIVRNLPHCAPGMGKALVEELEKAGRHAELIDHYTALLARPTRNPSLLVGLAERIEHGAVRGELPAPLQRAQCLLQLAVHLNRHSAGNALLTRVRARLSTLLASGKEPLLAKLLENIDLETLRGFVNLVESGVDPMLDRVFTRVAVRHSPDVFRGEERPFWQTEGIWTTRRGLHSQQEVLRVLREVKIPANAEAIGVAASYGDLSENSEWEAAIEEQRQLTSRAMELESALRLAHLIENVTIPDNTVCPGTEVRYREKSSGNEHTVRILGPWDAEHHDSISYRSPLAAGMLGLHRGDSCLLQLPTGPLEVEVVEVELIDLDRV
jgi:transcription elongation factor GreA